MLPGARDIHTALCKTLSGRIEQVDWASFTASDWNMFAAMAKAEGVAPLIYHHIARANVSTLTVPPPAFNALRVAYYETVAQNALLYEELERILGALGEAEIPVIVLKGAALALTVYENIGLRPMSDLDLLVGKNYIAAAVQIMETLGYVRDPEAALGLDERAGYHIHFRDPSHPFVDVELHWKLHWTLGADNTGASSALVHWLWEQVERGDEFGDCAAEGADNNLSRVWVLKPTAQLLVLATHAWIQHQNESRLVWLYDIALLLRQGLSRIDVPLLISQAEALRWEAAFSAAIERVQKLFDIALPERLSLYVLAHSEDPDEESANSQVYPTRSLYGWRKLKSLGWTVRLRLIFALIFPSFAYMRQRYQFVSIWALPFYYLYRWFDMLRDGLRTLRAFVFSQ